MTPEKVYKLLAENGLYFTERIMIHKRFPLEVNAGKRIDRTFILLQSSI
ncbi:MAG: hypothetical protein PEPC_01738 [Peptostreptococcus russellii]